MLLLFEPRFTLDESLSVASTRDGAASNSHRDTIRLWLGTFTAVLAMSVGLPLAFAATSTTWTQSPGGCSFLGNSDLPGGNTAVAGTYNQSSWCLATVELRMGYKVDGYWYYRNTKTHTGEGGGVTDLKSGADGTNGRHRSKVGGSWTSYKYTNY